MLPGVFWILSLLTLLRVVQAGEPNAVPLPPTVQAVWDLDKAYHETTPTRERICLNGLWMWQPAESLASVPPIDQWGYLKVPGCWPGISDYMQKDCQTVFAHPSWLKLPLADVTAAWYQRRISIPTGWAGRRITISLQYLSSYAAVYLDGKFMGEIRFPAGDLDLSAVCRPGGTYLLSLLVVAMPLKAVMLSFTDSASARQVKGSVARRGLCGDVFLESTPFGPRLEDVRAYPSVRQQDCTFDAALEALRPGEKYFLCARVHEPNGHGTTLKSAAFQANNLKAGRMAFTKKWMPKALWDVDTPQNTCALEVSLLDSSGKVVDIAWPSRFGFRQLWIDGRDFFLNGTRLFLSAVPLDNAQISAALATYEGARESLQRLQSIGINFVYTHNYDCLPGSHLGFEEILRAADDVGMLVGFTQPHFSHYDWQGAHADQTNGYAQHAGFYVRAAQNHPAVVMYAMSHNATGYEEDMNPDLIDGLHSPRDTWSLKNSALALRAEAIVKGLDPSRIVYHHASGNLGSMHPINFYPNFAPIQELSDWFEHWATDGVKPVFTCEYGAPFTWDWTMYRGWYKGQREFGSATVPWEFCLAEWNAQFFGDRAYRISEAEKANLRWEAQQFRAGKVWHRWDYPNQVGSTRFEERYPVFERFLTDNWRAFRSWGVSAVSPWEFEHFWILRAGVDKSRRELKVDWAGLQRPGFSPDYLDTRYERMDLAFDRSDWMPTLAAQALLRNNGPLLAYLAGKPARFTSKDHNFMPGEKIDKQLILINNSRHAVTAACDWAFKLPRPIAGKETVRIEPGTQKRVPLHFDLPASLPAGTYQLKAVARFNSETQTDALSIDVLSVSSGPNLSRKIALFDPRGESGNLLNRLGIACQTVNGDADLSSYDLLIVGKSALTVDGPAPSLNRVPEGFKVLLFEQTSEALEKRLGLRTEERGLRQVFARVPDHPVLTGLTPGNLHDWRGQATLLPPRLKYELRPRYGPTVQWCGLPVTRLWRCGNQGNLASVLIEKPSRGDFLPLLDGGYSLQYSPLLEYHEGRGLVMFCQMDVTGRTESEPAADTLVRNLLRYVAEWKPAPRRNAFYVGDAAGKTRLQAAGLTLGPDEGDSLSPDNVLIAGAGAGPMLAARASAISRWLDAGGHLLTIGLNQEDLNSWLPFKVATTNKEHISTFFDAPSLKSILAGIAPADLHNRDPRILPLVSSGAEVFGDGVIAASANGQAVFCQFDPWQFEAPQQPNLRRTYRRLSFAFSRLLANLGVAEQTPLLDRFQQPVTSTQDEKRWLTGFYVDQPQEWDDPYRFFRW